MGVHLRGFHRQLDVADPAQSGVLEGDLAVIHAMADYILVMKDGKVVEEGATEQIFAAPREPYTRDLMTAAFALTAFGTLG